MSKLTYHNYEALQIHPSVDAALNGCTNGETGAMMLWSLLMEDGIEDYEQMTKLIHYITAGEITSLKPGWCRYSEKYRLWGVNVSRREWRNGGNNYMHRLGELLGKQKLKYRYLGPKWEDGVMVRAGPVPDGGGVLLIALPLRQEQRKVVTTENEVVDEIIETRVHIPEEIKVPESPKVIRNVARKVRPVIELDEE